MTALLPETPVFSLPTSPWSHLVLKWHCLPLWFLPESFIDSELSLKSAEMETRRGGVLSNCSEEKFSKFKNHHLQLPYLHSIWQILLSRNLCLKLIKDHLPPFLTDYNCCSSLALPFDKWQQSNEMHLKWKWKGMHITSFNLLRWPHDLSSIISILQMRSWDSECLELTAAMQRN